MGLHNYRDLGHIDSMKFVYWDIDSKGIILLDNLIIPQQNGKIKKLASYGRLSLTVGKSNFFYYRKKKDALYSQYYLGDIYANLNNLKFNPDFNVPFHIYVYDEDNIWEQSEM